MADRLLRSCDALPEWKMEGVSDCKIVKKRDGRIHFREVISSILISFKALFRVLSIEIASKILAHCYP